MTWDASSQNVDSSVVGLDLKGSNRNSLNISNLSDDIEMYIPRTDNSQPEEPSYFTQNENLTMQFHIFPIKEEGESILLEIHPVNDTERFQAYIKKGSRPSQEEYDISMTIPDFSSCHYNLTVGYFNCSQDPYTMFIGGQLLEVGSIYFVAVQYYGKNENQQEEALVRQKRDCADGGGRVKRSCIKYKDPPPTPKPEGLVTIKPLFDDITSHNYSLRRNSLSCRYWDPISNKWSVQGCKVFN